MISHDLKHPSTRAKCSGASLSPCGSRPEFNFRNFIAMDPPDHEAHRKVVTPALSVTNVHRLEPLIRERAGKILDELPRGEIFNWVDLVSVEPTTQMLATLLDFPFEQRRRLTYWSPSYPGRTHSSRPHS